MKYHVSGADRDSGATVERDIDAPDEAAARQQASAAGLMVETLTAAATTSTSTTEAAESRYAVRVLASSVAHGQNGAESMRAELEKLLNRMSTMGWEFVSVQTMPTLTLARTGGTGRVSGENVAANVALAVFRSRV